MNPLLAVQGGSLVGRNRSGPVTLTGSGALRAVPFDGATGWLVEAEKPTVSMVLGYNRGLQQSGEAVLVTPFPMTPKELASMQNDDTSNPIPHGYCACGCGGAVAEGRTILKGHNNKRNPVDRFWEKVDVRSGDECWEWQGSRTPQGYGQLKVDGKTVRAHRFSYDLHYGDLDDDLDILHSCDNPPCVNPRHLSEGTNAANMADRNRKGRQARGDAVGKAKLTEAQVLAIREDNDSSRKIAKKHGIKHCQVLAIKHRQYWRHV